jgi:hypothetical protein
MRGWGRAGAATRAWIPWGLVGQVSGGEGRAVCGLPSYPDDGPWMEGHTTDLIYGDPADKLKLVISSSNYGVPFWISVGSVNVHRQTLTIYGSEYLWKS